MQERKPDSIVINPAREARKYAILTLEDGPEILYETTDEGDDDALVARVVAAAEKFGVTTIRVWKHGEAPKIVAALRQHNLRVLELS